MKILAIDTSTEACSAALYNSNDDNFRYECVSGIFELCPQQHSQKILTMIDQLLTEASVNLNNIDALAYGRGPGSFTGVRIAASTVQGLALGANLPVVEVSTLQAMAQQQFVEHGSEQCAVLIDARMNEVYQGLFQCRNGIAQLVGTESVNSAEQATQSIRSFIAQAAEDATSFAGTGFSAFSSEFAENLQNPQTNVNYPNAKYMLELALDQLLQSNTVSAAEVNPVYVRDEVTWQKLPHKQ